MYQILYRHYAFFLSRTVQAQCSQYVSEVLAKKISQISFLLKPQLSIVPPASNQKDPGLIPGEAFYQ